jgi:tRNA pseudouridine38-40 synthase
VDLTLFDEPTGPVGPVVRVRLLVAYHGRGFRGLAPNAGVRTVVGELIDALAPILGYRPEITMAGRTDAGVHAWGQVLSLDVPADRVDLVRIQRSVNRRLGPEVVIRQLDVVPPDFDARRHATARLYRYTVVNRPVPDPFRAEVAWWVADPLDVGAMALACDPLIGEHDFSSFCRRPRGPSGGDDEEVSLVRRVTDARWDDLGDGILRFSIRGSAFCHQMVRSIVGLHVAVGRGRRRAGEVRAVLEARDRAATVSPAPAGGLCLWAVEY